MRIRLFDEQYANDLPNPLRLDAELDLWEDYWNEESNGKVKLMRISKLRVRILHVYTSIIFVCLFSFNQNSAHLSKFALPSSENKEGMLRFTVYFPR